MTRRNRARPHRETVRASRMRRVLTVLSALLVLSGSLVGWANEPALAAGSPLVSFPFTDASESGLLSAVPIPATHPAPLPCLTAGAAAFTAPIPGCGLANPDQPGTGRLRLSDAQGGGAAAAVLNTTLPTFDGLVLTFDQYQYGGSGGDGVSVDLAVAPPASLGQAGGALGYSSTSDPHPGLPGGYLGIGFDATGNYTTTYTDGSGCADPPFAGFNPNTVSVRGPGNGGVGYCLLSSTASAGALPFSLRGLEQDSSKRSVRVTLDPAAGTFTVEMDPAGGTTFQLVTSGSLPALYFDPSTGATIAGVPPRLSVVLAGSTAGLADIHEIDDLAVSTVSGTPPVLALAVGATATVKAGASFGYTITPSIAAGTDETQAASLRVTDTLPAGITLAGTPQDGAGGAGASQWDCSASTSTAVNCAFIGTGVVTAGTTLDPIKVNATVAAATLAGGLYNTATVVSNDAKLPTTASQTIPIVAATAVLAAWSQQHPASSPPGRFEANSAFDAVTGTTVVFGGLDQDDVTLLGDTWTYDGITWTQQHPATSPPVRRLASMAFDAARGTVVLFGGLNTTGLLADTWTWDGHNWSEQVPAVSPTPRAATVMAFDAAINDVVLFGGENGAIIAPLGAIPFT